MDYPVRTDEFLLWIKDQPLDILSELQLELLATEANVETQLADHHAHEYTTGPNGDPLWEHKATVKLRMTRWRLHVTTMLLENQARAFQREAKRLLDHDTYTVILEAATDAARAS